jgi:hypothetical protein
LESPSIAEKTTAHCSPEMRGWRRGVTHMHISGINNTLRVDRSSSCFDVQLYGRDA